MTPGATRLLRWGIAGVTSAGALAMTAVAVWGLRRGFDFTDEGFYLLGYQPQQPATSGLQRFDVLVKGFLGWITPGLGEMRALHLAAVLVSSAVLAAGLTRWLRAEGGRASGRFWFPLLAVGGLLAYAFGPPTLSYNHLTAFFLVTAVGLVLAYCAQNWPGASAPLLPAAAGVLLALCFFVKFSSSVAGLLLAGAALAVLARAPRRDRLIAIGALGAGYVLGALVYFVVAESPSAWYGPFARDLADPDAIGHGSGTITSVLLTDLRRILEMAPMGIPALGAIVVALRMRSRWPRGLVAALLVAGAGLLGRDFLLRAGVFEPHDLATIGLVLLLALATLGAVAAGFPALTERRGRIRLGLACVLLLAVPVAGSLGTSNGLLVGGLFFLTPVMAVAVVISRLIAPHARDIALAVTTLALTAFAVARFADGYVSHPYRLAGGLGDQTVTVHVPGPLDGARVAPSTAAFIAGLEGLRRRHSTPGRPIIGMYDVPGEILVLGGFAPGERFSASVNIRRTCRELVRDPPRDPLLLVSHTSFLNAGGPLPCLAQIGAAMDSYQPAGTVTDPALGLELDIYAR